MKAVFVRTLRFAPALLLLAYIDCGGSDKPTEPATATSIAANSPAVPSAVAGTAVAPVPSVIVRDQNGNPFPGATVNFTVSAGGGTVNTPSVVTNSDGIATVVWTLGKTPGQNALVASSGTVSVTFTVTGTAGPPALLVVSAGENQFVAAGSPAPINPAVSVQDANGNIVAGTKVTFTVGAGGGSVTGATPTSNAAGIATVGSWTMGSAPGSNTLIASADGVPSLTFHAIATSVKCATRTTHVFGTTTAGKLETDDCQFSDGSFVDFFSTAVPQANAYLFRQTAGFDAYLLLASPDGTPIAENDDETGSTTNSAVKVLLPAADTYLLGAGSLAPSITGDYTISSEITSPDNANCDVYTAYFVVKNVSTTQSIDNKDCLVTSPPAAPIYGDLFVIFLQAGQSVTVNMSSSAVDSFLQLIVSGGQVLAQNDNRDGTTNDARVTFTAPVTNYYGILARSAVASQVGAYTLTVQ